MNSVRHRFLLLSLSAVLLAGCKDRSRLFQSLSPSRSGVEFTNLAVESDDLSILDYLYFYNGGGVAIGDINNDELPDIYLTSNQGPNKLFLNKGGLKFEDITSSAGVAGTEGQWNTGVSMADVNGDGLLDIYVCSVVGLLGFDGHNELFINQGDGTFREESEAYGLDFDTYSSSAAFFDYDQDGDLDMYLLNHAVHTQDSYGNSSLRYERNYSSGDRLLRNDSGVFTDVSEEAGIFGGVNGYGLGLCTADFNRDGFTDIFIGNDFHEDDYFYLNQGDGTFKECLREYFGHTSRFSMGNDSGDLNGDGFTDLVSLDMLPEDEAVLKSSEGDDNVRTQQLRVDRFGYHYQYSRNMVYFNQPGGQFMETALLSGMAATDWSWTSLISDFDLDGNPDVFITNGIARRPNDLDFIRYASNEQIRQKLENTSLVDRKALELMPEGAVPNRIFRGTGSLVLEDYSKQWLDGKPTLSGSAAKGDLDGDGDLDLVINNFNSPADILINQADKRGNFLKIRLKGPGQNSLGIGTQVFAYAGDKTVFRELYTSRGFQSSCEPILHLGLGANAEIDSLRVVWPNGTTQKLTGIASGQTLNLTYKGSAVVPSAPLLASLSSKAEPPVRFEKDSTALGIDYMHREDRYIHFNREPLIPFSVADRGPAVLLGDLDGDGREDLFFGGSKYMASIAFAQRDSSFLPWQVPEVIRLDSIREWTGGQIADFDGNGKADMVLAAGGSDFSGKSPVLNDGFYLQHEDGSWIGGELPGTFGNTAMIRPFDFDGDGDLDLFVGTQSLTGQFGHPSDSYLFRNEAGRFVLFQTISFEGMPTDAHWFVPKAGQKARLLVVGEWMPPTLFELGDAGKLQPLEYKLPSGLWECLEPIDWDRDGDLDFAIGNWGLNTKLTASAKHPLRLYTADYDQNGSTESIVCTHKADSYYPMYSFDDLSSQLPFLKKEFTQYKDFAGQDMEGIFGKEAVESAHLWEVEELRSGILINEGDGFRFEPLPELLQVSPILDFLALDVDGEAGDELLAAGNYFGVKPYQGRFDAFPGALIDPEGKVYPGTDLGLDWQQKSARELRLLEFQGQRYILVAFNNAKAELYKMKE